MREGLVLAIAICAALAACRRAPAGPAVPAPARYATAAAVVDEVVYLIGGMERSETGDTTVAAVAAYDPDARSWTGCAPMPTARAFAAAVAFEEKVYVFGGLDTDGAALDVVEIYDPSRDTWSVAPPMPVALSRLAAVNHMGNGIVVGGGTDADETNTVDQRVYVPGRNIWREWPDLTAARHGHGLVDADDGTERMFAVGGYDDNGLLDATDWWGIGIVRVRDADGNLKWPGAYSTDNRTGVTTAFDQDYRAYVWQTAPPLHQARGFHGLAKVGGLLYAVGGRCSGIPRTEILDMGAVEDGWREAAPLPKDLCRFSLVEWNGRLLAFGGETEFGKTINTEVLVYDPAEDAWTVR